MLPHGQFAQWIAPLTVGEEGGVWVVYGKNQFACNMLKSQFAGKIEAVREELAAYRPAFVFKPGEGVRYEMAAVEGAVEPAEPSLHAGSEEMPVQEVLLDELPSEKPVKPAASKTAADILAERMKNLPHEPRQAAGLLPGRNRRQLPKRGRMRSVMRKKRVTNKPTCLRITRLIRW